MEHFIWIGCILLAALAAVYAVICRIRLRRMADRLERMLDAALSGCFSESAFDESRLSKLETMLYRYLSAGELSKRKLSTGKERIQSFISDISHQTKTPVANIKLYSDLLAERVKEDPETGEILTQIQSQSEKLSFLIQALVKASRLESGVVSVQPRRQSIGELAGGLKKLYAPSAEAAGLSFVVRTDPTLTAVFDLKWTAEAIGNLIDNAIKYTPAGGTVTLTAREYELFLCLAVRDTGIGIAEAELPRLFERFYRSSNTAQTPGVGLGLYLTREILSRQDGYLKVQSAPGEGSEFSVFLPR